MGVILSLSGTSAWAQTSQVGSVAGQVTDESHAVVPGVAVKLKETTTNTTLNTNTNSDGRYVFSSVVPGNYNLSFVKQGFSTYEVNGQVVEVSSAATVNAVLKVGTTATTVEVTASAGAQLQTSNATVGGSLNGTALLLLPNLGRDVTSMAVLQPATTPTGFSAGSYQDANTYTLDGANVTDDMGGNTIGYQTNYSGLGGSQGGAIPSGVVPTPIESIDEIKVNVANQSSDFNNSSGAQIQMVSKRGTNQIHGTAYLFYYDNAIGQANSWGNNHTPLTFGSQTFTDTPVDFPKNHRSRFGGALGGPIIPKNFLGGKWYGFFNYEALRFPNAQTYSKTEPTALLRAGIITVPNASGVYTSFNINPAPVNVNGVTYPTAVCPAGACDPRGIGISPVVSTIWNKELPPTNNPLGGDTYNTQTFLSSIHLPQTSNNYVGRIDHDFNDKEHFFVSYRDYKLVNLTSNQVDVGGILGGQFGTPTPTAPRPQQPSVWTAGLTSTISSTTTNTFVFSYLRQFWQWGSDNGPAQPIPGLGGAVELGGDSSGALIPYNVNTQSVRQRFWDGQDKSIKDDINMLKGNHLFGFGGTYQRDFDYHSRTDNGSGVNDQISYLSTSSGFNWTSPTAAYIPTSVPSSSYSTWETYYAEITGMLSSTQVMYSRALPALSILPVGTPATDKDIIPSYNTYFYDTWKMKPSFTLTYGLGWALEMPPYELQGKQVELVDQNNQPISAQSFLAQREAAALQGGSYTPQIGYTMIRNVGDGPKYPYNPFYGEFSPRVNFAWNPRYTDGILGKVFGSGKTVIRGGYGRIFGRLNGVDLVLVPLLGPGLLQGVVCTNPLSNGTCAGSGVATPQNAFRIGPDGLVAPLTAASPTISQPFYPGVGANPETVDPDSLDPNFKPDRTDQLTVTIQRQVNNNMQLEVGYIGKIIKNEYMLMNLDAVPTMETLNGQAFSAAYAQVYEQMEFNGQSPANVTAQPFFEAAMGGSSSSYCQGYSSCTAALASKNTALFKEVSVSSIWAAMSATPGWTLGRTVFSAPVPGGTVGQSTSLGDNTSLGWGNYNAVFVTFRTNNYHGLTTVSNFTWGRSLGTSQLAQYNSASTPLTPYYLQDSYGEQNFDIKFLYNLSMYYQPQIFRGQRGVLGHILGGWTIAPLFTAQSGSGIAPGYTEAYGTQAFGEVTTSSSSVGSTSEDAVGLAPYTGNISARYNVYPTGTANGNNAVLGPASVGTKTSGYFGLNGFANPAQVYSEFRPCVLGYDTNCGGYYNLRGLPTWDLDTNVIKDIGIYKERVSAKLFFSFTNVLNHFQPGSPSLNLSSPTTFGQLGGQANTPRNMEFGIRLGW